VTRYVAVLSPPDSNRRLSFVTSIILNAGDTQEFCHEQ
jgi:hypothetical protein